MTRSQTEASAEQRRLDALHALGVLDTLPEAVFDAITQAAALACDVPISLVSLLDADRQWFKSNVGLPGVAQTPRDVAFCDHAIRGDGLFEVPNALEDPRFAANPLVTADPAIRFYAGSPIVMPGGERIGTVCVIDHAPRQLSAPQVAMLQGLSRIASVALLDRQRQLEMHRQLVLGEARYRAIVEDQSELVSLSQADGTLTFVNGAYARHFGGTPEQLVGSNLLDLVGPEARPALQAQMLSVTASGMAATGIHRSRSAQGEVRWISWISRSIGAGTDQAPMIHSVGRDVTEQIAAEAGLREALAGKDTLLKEVYHRVKNNLQIVQSLLSLQQRSTDQQQVRLALAESARRVRAMALVHEKLYQSDDLAAVSLRDYTQDLVRQIDAAAGARQRRVMLVTQIDDLPCGLDSAIPFGLLVTELVSNALEHGFAEDQAGEVRIVLALRDGLPWLSVADNGRGLQPGFSLDSGASMGLQLACSLAQQLGGALEAHNAAGAVFSTPLPRLAQVQAAAPA